MKDSHSRRQFIKTSALFAGAGMSFPVLRTFADDTNASTALPEKAYDIAPSGHLKIEYHGRFAELPVGSVTPRCRAKPTFNQRVKRKPSRSLPGFQRICD